MSNGKPTPTQEENDKVAMGEPVHEHEADGSPPDPGAQPPDQQRRAQRAGEYQTRDMRSGQHTHPAPHARPGTKHDDK